MTTRFPVVFEQEASGVISAYVAGVPVYAQGETQKAAERAIQRTLAAYLEMHPDEQPTTTIKVASVYRATHAGPGRVALLSPAALIGARTSAQKAASSRANGRLGGRPRTVKAGHGR